MWRGGRSQFRGGGRWCGSHRSRHLFDRGLLRFLRDDLGNRYCLRSTLQLEADLFGHFDRD